MGNRQRLEGLSWEEYAVLKAHQQGILTLSMGLRCRIVGFRNGRPNLVLEKSHFDFVFVDQWGTVVFLDCKSFDSDRITYSQLTRHQIETLEALEHHKARSGYLIHFRKIDAIVFFDASKLRGIKPRESLLADQGQYLGTWQDVALGGLFT